MERDALDQAGERLEPAAWRPGLVSAQPSWLRALLRISRLAMDLVANDARRHLCKISDQGLVERLELRPENVAQEALGAWSMTVVRR